MQPAAQNLDSPQSAVNSRDDLIARGWAALPSSYRIPDVAPSLAEARASLERLIGMADTENWGCLDEYLLTYVADPAQRATVFASSFAAALELVREGELELNQKEAFAPLYFRKRPTQAQEPVPAPDL